MMKADRDIEKSTFIYTLDSAWREKIRAELSQRLRDKLGRTLTIEESGDVVRFMRGRISDVESLISLEEILKLR